MMVKQWKVDTVIPNSRCTTAKYTTFNFFEEEYHTKSSFS